MSRLSLARGLMLLVVALGIPGAAAAQTRVAGLVPQVTPTVSVEVGERFQSALVEGLGRVRGVTVVPTAEVQQALATPDLLACDAAPCFGRIAARLRATRLVTCQVKIIGKAYAVTLRVIDEFGREMTRVERHCEICTLAEAEETIGRAATELGSALTGPPAPVAPPPASRPAPPASAPASAPITPWTTATPPAATQSVTTVPPLRQRIRTWNWRTIGLVATGVAVVGFAVGVPLAAIANEPTCDRPNGRRTCPEVYTTAGGGAAFLTIGILAAGAAGTSFYLNWKFGRERALEVAPTAGPKGAGVTARWQW
ncbi:MAG TPA: hypothetical protein VGQ83_18055 [Polyangia bacterium]|jgi:hypothetical protein